jgi:putative aldouronate transport system permease protein
MLLPALTLMAVFSYYPLWGLRLAFVKYEGVGRIAAAPWVGLANFERFFGGPYAARIISNTLFIAIGKIILGQVAAIIVALLINEVRHQRYKRVIQTISTFPHFLSWVIIGAVMVRLLSTVGPINRVVEAIGLPAVPFLTSTTAFPWTLIGADIWKGVGFGAIIYLAGLMSINPELYEAATVDGAGRFQRLWYISLPGIFSTIALMACLNLGGILNAGFEQVLVLYNPVVYKTGDILDTYIYREGYLGSEYSLGSAVGLFKSTIGFCLIMLSYWLADRFANYRIF